jgi:putative multiple sugar transport system substrate-binding protein
MKKHSLLLLTALSLVTSMVMAACAPAAAPAAAPEAAATEAVAEEAAPEAAAEGAGYVGISMPTKSSTRWISDGENMVKVFESMGYKADLQYAEDDIPTQLTQIESMVTKGSSLPPSTAPPSPTCCRTPTMRASWSSPMTA